MSGHNFSTFVVAPLLGWLAAVSLALVVYLARLEIMEFRRNRRMAAARKRLGLRQA